MREAHQDAVGCQILLFECFGVYCDKRIYLGLFECRAE